MILSRSDPYGLRGAIKPGHLPERPVRPETMDSQAAVMRCRACDVPIERCCGQCRSDEDQDRVRTGGKKRRAVDQSAVRRLDKEGKSKSQIARELDISVDSVARALKKSNQECHHDNTTD